MPGQVVDLREASRGRALEKALEKRRLPAATSDVDADGPLLRSDVWPIVIPDRMAEALKADSKDRHYTIVEKAKKDIDDIGREFF